MTCSNFNRFLESVPIAKSTTSLVVVVKVTCTIARWVSLHSYFNSKSVEV